ncbi:excalibur calcium-binding domain-containing protein [Lysinibacillus xylanilyticus]|uniref:Excalibur calcium-binding domain-containing protein n=1 Tax=Lysinibacillus xylanilyticus TaxID=582475 RepID=A0A2M9Q4A9_9BACI|nr:excalibur calcium-binding domain-containing protein [Lysinibacillus xylanilyticus]PJO42917.1 hypothetical protein CWD94_14130 [Lysinibacillus xylanilyticus]
MNGCLTLIIVIIALAIIINFPLFTIGIALICWGIYEYKINKNLKAKSKLIPTIITLGCILSFSGCALTLTNDTKTENVESSKKDKEDVDENKAKQVETTSVENTTDTPTTTSDTKQESEQAPQIKKEEEKKELKEEPVVNNEQNQEVNSSSNNTSNSGASGTQPSSNSQETVNTVTTPSTPQKEYFKNCTELRKVYPSGVPANHPAYASKHDRDKDGWACER